MGSKSETLARIATYRFEAGEKDGARQTIVEALECVHMTPSAAGAFKKEYHWGSCYAEVAKHYLDIGDPLAAREIAKKIPNPKSLELADYALAILIVRQAEAGDIDGAMELVHLLDESKSEAMFHIALAQVRSGEIAVAELSITSVDSEFGNAFYNFGTFYRSVAKTHFEAGNIEKAKEAIARALSLAKETDTDFLPLAELQLEIGDLKGMRETAESNLRTPYRFHIRLFASDYHRILDLQIRLGDVVGARQIIAEFTKCPEELARQLFDREGLGDGKTLDREVCTKIENICKWTHQAAEWQKMPEIINFDGFLRDQQGKGPKEASRFLESAADDLKDALLMAKTASSK